MAISNLKKLFIADTLFPTIWFNLKKSNKGQFSFFDIFIITNDNTEQRFLDLGRATVLLTILASLYNNIGNKEEVS